MRLLQELYQFIPEDLKAVILVIDSIGTCTKVQQEITSIAPYSPKLTCISNITEVVSNKHPILLIIDDTKEVSKISNSIRLLHQHNYDCELVIDSDIKKLNRLCNMYGGIVSTNIADIKQYIQLYFTRPTMNLNNRKLPKP
jgi:hypothetical protein